MNRTISLLMIALVCAASEALSQVNPKVSQLFEELTAMGKPPFGYEPSVIKRGGFERYGNRPQLEYSLHLFYRPDIIRGRKDSIFVDSILREQKKYFDKQVKAIRRTINTLLGEAKDSCHYESHASGKDTVFYSLNLSHDTLRVHKYQEGNYTYYNSDEFLDFRLESGKKEGTYEGNVNYTVSLPLIEWSATAELYTWNRLKDDIKCLLNEHGISHRNALWQHDMMYSDSIWNEASCDWIGMGTYGEMSYEKAGVTEAAIYSLPEEQEPLAGQMLSAIDSLVQSFTDKQQDCYYQYHYNTTFGGFTPQILTCYNSRIPETNSIRAQAEDHGFHFLILETRGSEWIPLEYLSLKSFVNGKKTYFDGIGSTP